MLLDVWDDHLLETAGRIVEEGTMENSEAHHAAANNVCKWLGIRSSKLVMRICVQFCGCARPGLRDVD